MTVDSLRPGRTPVKIKLGESLDSGSLREAVIKAMSSVSYFGGVTPEALAEGKVTVDNLNRMSFEAALRTAQLSVSILPGEGDDTPDVLQITRGDGLLAYDLSPGARPDEKGSDPRNGNYEI
jgi:hypothetical protein